MLDEKAPDVRSQASAAFCNQASGGVNAFVANSAYRGVHYLPPPVPEPLSREEDEQKMKSVSVDFFGVIGFEMTSCDYWGSSPYILDFESVEKSCMQRSCYGIN